jgi:hypothetical protein
VDAMARFASIGRTVSTPTVSEASRCAERDDVTRLVISATETHSVCTCSGEGEKLRSVASV